jgi:hypothetical protein
MGAVTLRGTLQYLGFHIRRMRIRAAKNTEQAIA